MSANDRHQIVALTSGFQGYQVPGYVVSVTRSGEEAGFFRAVPYLPKPIEAEQLMVSPLGGWLRSQGQWSPLPETAPPVIRVIPPDIRRILRPLESLTRHGTNVAIAQPVNMNEELMAISGLRIYLNRPWFSSGEGELLGVALWSEWNGELDDQMRDKFKPFFTQ
ncbi:MAG TPA: hypothetical protein VKA09_01875 [Nitrososphaeraceae archaeon]|nr:hypothetical protein [Nitrososphaeraceae archaeon]